MRRPGVIFISLAALTLANLALRLLIYYETTLFHFADYTTYLQGVDRLAAGERVFPIEGNFIMTISYLGYLVNTLFRSGDAIFILNALLGTAASLLVSILVVRVTGNRRAGVLTLVLLTIYTEFMVFSAVFYTPVLMIFLLVLLMWGLYNYYNNAGRLPAVWLLFITAVFIISLIFKPELLLLPLFLAGVAAFSGKDKLLRRRTAILMLVLLVPSLLYPPASRALRPEGTVSSNSFIFFGHTAYGGDGGEGSFVYRENEERYEERFSDYCLERGITGPGIEDYNGFHRQEIVSFITRHPFRWMALQARKFTRTFGIIPEGTSFKVLYSGLMEERSWLTIGVVVGPFALVMVLFVLFFDPAISRLGSREKPGMKGFINIYMVVLLYYLVASILFGQYQERYRMPIMVLYIIPAAGYFIVSYSAERFFRRRRLVGIIASLVLLFAIWGLQAAKGLGNTDRFQNAIDISTDIRAEEERAPI